MKTIPFSLVFSLLTAAVQAEFIGIPKAEFQPHYRAQKEPMWCWASSAEMVLSYQGIRLPQEAIVTRIKGFPINQGGSAAEMIRSVNGVFKDTAEKTVVVSGQFVPGAPESTVLYNQLKKKRPVMLTYQANMLSGHAVVITGIEASLVGGRVLITQLHIFDPFSYRPGPPVPVFAPNGFILGYQPGGFVKDDSLTTKVVPIATDWWNRAYLPNLGAVTGMILIDATVN